MGNAYIYMYKFMFVHFSGGSYHNVLLRFVLFLLKKNVFFFFFFILFGVLCVKVGRIGVTVHGCHSIRTYPYTHVCVFINYSRHVSILDP